MTISIGNDHAAFDMKFEIKEYLEGKGYTVINEGTDTSERVDYPDIALKVANDIKSGRADKGILICGTGVGMSIAANKIKKIRACVCSEPYSARLTVEHNNANIICFGARVIGIETAKMIVDSFLEASFQGGRHQQRLDKITDLENLSE